KFSDHAVTLRSSPTVLADTPMSLSALTCIESGKPPSATWSAATLLGLHRIWASSCPVPCLSPQDTHQDCHPAPAIRRRAASRQQAEHCESRVDLLILLNDRTVSFLRHGQNSRGTSAP